MPISAEHLTAYCPFALVRSLRFACDIPIPRSFHILWIYYIETETNRWIAANIKMYQSAFDHRFLHSLNLFVFCGIHIHFMILLALIIIVMLFSMYVHTCMANMVKLYVQMCIVVDCIFVFNKHLWSMLEWEMKQERNGGRHRG